MDLNPLVISNIIAFIFFNLSGLLLILRWRDARLPVNVLIPLFLAVFIYVLISLSNILEHAGVTDYLDSYEDIAEVAFLFICVLFVNNWNSKISLEIEKRNFLKQKIAMDLSKLAHWEYDVASDLFTFDDQFYALFATSASKQGSNHMLSGEYAERFFPPEEKDVIAREIKIALEATDPDFIRHLEHRIIRVDGQERYLNVSFGIEKDKDGKTVKIYGANQDITERKRAELALQSENKRRRLLMDASRDGIAIFNLEHQVVEANQRFCEMLGYSPEEILRLHSWDIDAAMSEEQIRNYFTKFSETSETFETIHRRKNGSICDVEVSASGTLMDDKPLVVTIVRDITERKRADEALAASEEKYRLVVENTREGILIIRDGVTEFYNQRAVEMSGYSEPEYRRMNFLEFIHPDDRAYILEKHQKAMRDGPDVTPAHQSRAVHKSGEVRWIESNTVALSWRGKRAFLVFIQDITERKQAEEELRQSEERNRRILHTAMDGFCRTDSNGRLLEVNEAYCRMSGYKEQELLAMSIAELEASENPGDVAARMQILMKKGEDRFETKHVRKDGTMIDVEVSVQYRAGNGSGECVAFVRNITEQKETEIAIRDFHTRLVQILEFLPDPTFSIDAQGKVLIWNRAMEELTGIPADEILGRGDYAYSTVFYNERRPVLLDLVLNPDPNYADRYADYEREGDRLVSETYLEDFRGRGRTWLSNIASPLRDNDGKVIGAIESVRDVTNWRMLEEERAKIESQVRQTQKMEAIGTLAGGIAHDFNNILSAIIGYSELLQMKLGDDREALSKIQGILKAGLRARDLVHQILTFSRKTDQEHKPIQVDLIVEEALKLLRATLPSNIDIEKQLDSNSMIMGDPTQIHQVIMNLCTNAGHAMREDGGKLRVELHDTEIDSSTAAMHLKVEPGKYLSLVISDTGAGIEPDSLERIFEPFFTTKARDEGTGLGLSVVHGIVTGLGGMIHAYSEPGQGSTFSVYLPVLQSQGSTKAEERDLSAYHGTENILVVDDEEAIAEVAAELLSNLGYRVEIVTDSQEALAYFQKNPRKFDLVVADVTMPVLTGDGLAQQMRRINNDLPIILATGFSNRVSDEKARELGVWAIIKKPFMLANLATVVRQALDDATRG